MKKTLLLTFLILFLTQQAVFAEDSCPISTGPTDGVKTYLKDVDTVLYEVNSESRNSSCNKSGTGITDNAVGTSKQVGQIIATDANKLYDVGGFLTSWEFNLGSLAFVKIPESFYRDHDYIENQTAKINKLQMQISKRCGLETVPKSKKLIELANKYKIGTSDVSEILSGFRDMNINATMLFRCTVVGTLGSCESPDDENPLYQAIQSGYDEDVRTACQEKETSMKDLWEKIKNLTDGQYGFSKVKDAMKKWERSLDLLFGRDTSSKETFKERERQILAKELSRQGLSATQADAMLANLDNFNNGQVSIKSYIQKQITSLINPFEQRIKEAFQEMKSKIDNTKDWTNKSKDLSVYDGIIKDIRADHDNQLPLIKMSDTATDVGIANLIQLHQNLIDTNKNITDSLDAAREACEAQAKGQTPCDF